MTESFSATESTLPTARKDLKTIDIAIAIHTTATPAPARIHMTVGTLVCFVGTGFITRVVRADEAGVADTEVGCGGVA